MAMRLSFFTGLCLLMALAGCGSGEGADSAPADAPSADSTALAPADTARRAEGPVILVLGNSIAAGYGLELEQAFPHLLQQKIDSLGLPHRVINAGLSGETTAAGVERLPWMLRQPVDILIIELGGNDGLRGIPPEATRQNLRRMIEIARRRYPNIDIVLCGMLAPPNMGRAYTDAFQAVFPEVASEKGVVLLPFILEGVAGEPELNQPDGIHPTPVGHRIVAQNVWEVLRPLLREPS
jgi:acyl-CoA thioesterase I